MALSATKSTMECDVFDRTEAIVLYKCVSLRSLNIHIIHRIYQFMIMNFIDTTRALLTGALLLFAARPASAVNCFWSPASQMSNSTIVSMAQDAQGYIWLGTEYGLNRYDGHRYTYYLQDERDSCSLNDNHITALFADLEGTLWVGTRQGLQRYDASTDRFEQIPFGQTSQLRIKQMCCSDDGTLWCATSGYGLWRVADGVATRSQVASAEVDDSYCQSVAYDAQGNVWVGDPRGTVLCLPVRDGREAGTAQSYELPYGEIKQIVPTRGDTVFFLSEYALSCYDGRGVSLLASADGNKVFETAMLTRDDRLLVGTLDNGLMSYTGDKARPFVQVYFQAEEVDVDAVSVRALLQDRTGNIWAGCYLRGLMQLPAEEVSYMVWSLSEDELPSSCEITSVVDYNDRELLLVLPGKGIYHAAPEQRAQRYDVLHDAGCLCRDRKGTYWVSASDGIYEFNPDKGTARRVVSVPKLNAHRMTVDKQGRLYLANYGQGLLVYDPAKRQLNQYDMYHPLGDDPSDHLCNDWIQDLLSDSRGNVWCATAAGICCFDPRSETFSPFGWSELFPEHLCQCLAEDADGNILVGTNGGVYVYNQRTRQISEEPIPGLGLMSRSVCGIVTMCDRTAWISTTDGIWLYDPEVGTLQPYNHVEGKGGHDYNAGVAYLLPHGDVLFGQHDGFVVFNPERARNSHFELKPMVLTAFVRDNQVVRPGELSGSKPVYLGNVTEAHDFTLSPEHNSFVMEFASLHFNYVYSLQLQYSIDGGRWQDAAVDGHSIAFNHLPSGDYEIRVRARYQEACSPESVYHVRVRHPWFLSWWMDLVYVLLILSFVLSCFQIWMRHRRMQVEDEKMDLLIDSMHDIRTPLTLILSPLHQLRERYQNEPDTARKLKGIEHNAHRILVQVNQILDVRKFDKEQMDFAPQNTDLVRLVGDHVQAFQQEAQQRNIQLTYEHTESGPMMAPVDRSLFEKLMVTLLGDAMKFTPDGGVIDARLSQDGMYAVIVLADTGIGLPGGETEHIFRRFYQANQIDGGDGTALGLNLCLKIVERHGGTITAANREDGQSGSIFTVKLPLSAKTTETSAPAAAAVAPAEETAAEPAPARQPSRSQRILLVDDDTEITDYIVNELSGRYRFEACTNGYEALQRMLADPARFDVLISDIDMPEMDGLTLLRSVKSNGQLSHIPVVLLSSSTDINNRLEGLSAGADAFMTKPFVIDELRATVDALIANTLRHRSKFGGNVEAAKAATAQAADLLKGNSNSAADSKLLERIVKVVNQHLSEADFGVDELCVEVGVSRSQLHRRMKDLTGVGAGEFIRNIRLEQAARMLKETDMNVSQVAFAVGFSNLGHFSKIFRTHFGVYPSDYGESGTPVPPATPTDL